MQVELIVLRIVHVLGAIFWLGGSTFAAFFVLPAIAQAGAAGGQVMAILLRRKVFIMMPIVAVITMLAGIRLMMITSTNFGRGYFRMLPGKTYAVSALLAIVAFLLGVVVARPAVNRVSKLSGMASSDDFSRERISKEIAALQNRAAAASRIGIVILWIAAIGMAIARYL
jgi:uncharacterized membrane protein